MSDHDVFGVMWHPGRIELAAKALLQRYERDYFAAMERLDAVPAKSLPRIVNFEINGRLDADNSNLPAVFINAGEDDPSGGRGGRGYTGTIELEIEVAVEDTDLERGGLLARRMGTAMAAVLLDRPSLPDADGHPTAGGVRWIGGDNDVVDGRDRRICTFLRVLEVAFSAPPAAEAPLSDSTDDPYGDGTPPGTPNSTRVPDFPVESRP